MNQNNPSNSQQSMLSSINQIDGFDPTSLAVDYIDLNTKEKRKWLPVMAQMAWFRLKYPEGKIAISVETAKDCFVATARIYISYKDSADWYLAEATASRRFDPTKPTVSPREWAQTAAVGIALRNAGFGLQFGAAGADFESQATDELGAGDSVSSPATPTATPVVPQNGSVEPVAPPLEKEPEVVELTPKQRFEQACSVISPIKKHAGKTLGEVLNTEPRAINWLATRFSGDEQIKAAAEFICSYAMEQATA